ncbi:LPS export ABC transporter permease LptG [Sphingosinicella sp.]|uniref:LPS export ABC transporter permease LptG n=1 Tax=Sphingosinicella sp. TaxID=1917971 RepID=UPI00183C6D0A|nr:LPS export ABC transporter permease LptG [Sphingosinicella sp.]MBA4756941.1 LPS export ABC transporter permease LptG [Sphingosinicella sp.]
MSSALTFWPSRTIATYTARMFMLRTLAFAIGLVAILQTLDLLTESNKILAIDGNGNAELLRYVQLRVPQLISQFLPFSVLLGALVTMATLSQNSEVTIFRAAGLSAHQILYPMMAAALSVSLFHFAFNEMVLVRTNAELIAWEKAEYRRDAKIDTNPLTDVWVREGREIIHADSVTGSGASTVLHGVRVDRRDGSRLRQIINAASARPDRNAWQLENVRIFTVRTGALSHAPQMRLGAGIEPDRFTMRAPDPDRTNIVDLWKQTRLLESVGRSTDSLRVALYHKVSLPLSAVLMPLLGAVTAFGLARSGRLFARAVVGMVLGFAYFVADNFMVAMGEFGSVPPLAAGWAPFLLFFLVGEAVLFRTEE